MCCKPLTAGTRVAAAQSRGFARLVASPCAAQVRARLPASMSRSWIIVATPPMSASRPFGTYCEAIQAVGGDVGKSAGMPSCDHSIRRKHCATACASGMSLRASTWGCSKLSAVLSNSQVPGGEFMNCIDWVCQRSIGSGGYCMICA